MKRRFEVLPDFFLIVILSDLAIAFEDITEGVIRNAIEYSPDSIFTFV